MEYLFSVCKSLQAEMMVYFGGSTSQVAVDYIRRNKVEQLVMGEPESMEPGSFVYEVHKVFPGIPISIVDYSGAVRII